MRQPPTGTVTFLFTDIEGSTKLWQDHSQAMRPALARHDTLAAAIIDQHKGTLIKSHGEGDSLFAVFARATDAVTAAATLQLAFFAEPWSAEVPLHVRFALHTGEADLSEGDYFGSAVNRCARLRAIGHGGQVLVSRTTFEIVQDALPEKVTLRDVGEQRLRDLTRPEHVFQLLHPDLPAEFPPLKSLDAYPNNLPQQLTSFIGREREITEAKRLLSAARLLTLIGAGGCGKTRLSLQVAADVLDQYPDGAWLVELAPISDPALVPQTVASVLGQREQAEQTILQTLTGHLKPKSLLLVLDNCEHLLAAAADLADGLLQNCPSLHVLATSREALGVAGEQRYPVPPLSLPDPKKLPPLEALPQYEAVTLFIERARLVQPAFAVTNANAPAVAQVCHRLDGLPLALEMAAARVRLLTPEQIMARLDDRFRLLTGGSRRSLPRQKTLQATIDWSYDLLDGREQAVLRRLSVFAGGWSLEATEAVCADESVAQGDIFDVLASLVDKSLVRSDPQEAEVRYLMLETVCQYTADRLKESGETEAVRARHRDWYMALAEEAELQLTGPQQSIWLSRLEMEHDNLRAALTFSEGQSESVEAGLRLSGALRQFWVIHGHFTEGRHRLGRALEQTRLRHGAGVAFPVAQAKALLAAGILAHYQDEQETAGKLTAGSLTIYRQLGDQKGVADALHGLGNVAFYQDDYQAAQRLAEESLTIKRRLDDQHGIAGSLNNLGQVADQQGDYAAARKLWLESLMIYRQLGDQKGIALSLSNLGEAACALGDYKAAREYSVESLTIDRALGDQRNVAISLNNLGEALYFEGDYEEAREVYDEGLRLCRHRGHQYGIASASNNLARVECALGNHGTARAFSQESLTLYRELKYKKGIAYALEGSASLAHAEEQMERGARLFGAAHALREAIRTHLTPAEREENDQRIAFVRETLGEDAFTAAWESGQTMTWESAVEYALGEGEV